MACEQAAARRLLLPGHGVPVSAGQSLERCYWRPRGVDGLRRRWRSTHRCRTTPSSPSTQRPHRPRPASGPRRRTGRWRSGRPGTCADSLSIGSVYRLWSTSAVRRHPAWCDLDPAVGPLRGRQVGLHRLDRGSVGERGRRTRRHPRPGSRTLRADRRQVEREDVAGRARPWCPSATAPRRTTPAAASRTGPCRIGLPASWNVVVAIVLTSPKPPLTHFGFCIQLATVVHRGL